MESKNLKTLQLLDAIAEGRPTSQRELSDTLQISLGLVNSFIKRLVKKGYCKITTIPKNRVRYILTPAGAMEKTRLTYQYISSSYTFFKSAKERLQDLYRELQAQGKTRVIFYGTGEIADIAYLSMTGSPMHVIDVVDPNRAGSRFAEFDVQASVRRNANEYDALLITAGDNHEAIIRDLEKVGVPQDKIHFFS